MFHHATSTRVWSPRQWSAIKYPAAYVRQEFLTSLDAAPRFHRTKQYTGPGNVTCISSDLITRGRLSDALGRASSSGGSAGCGTTAWPIEALELAGRECQSDYRVTPSEKSSKRTGRCWNCWLGRSCSSRGHERLDFEWVPENQWELA